MFDPKQKTDAWNTFKKGGDPIKICGSQSVFFPHLGWKISPEKTWGLKMVINRYQ